MTGTVKVWKGEKGYGFIAPDDGTKDLFVHYTDILSDAQHRDLEVGAVVEYEPIQGERGMAAKRVRVIGHDGAR